jgi:hypothetical protein
MTARRVIGGRTLGPNTLFDKSALQSFNRYEALWFDNFYTAIVCPLFFVETLADLSKEVAEGRTPEQVVGNIAYKTPEMGPFVVAAHWNLRLANLLGYPIEMEGRPPVAGGFGTQLAGESATVYDLPPEMGAFERWQRGDFLGVERDFAQQWRSALSSMDLTSVYPIFRRLGGGKTKPRNLEEARQWAEQMVHGHGRRYTTLKVAMEMLAIPPSQRPRILQRWKQAAGAPLDEFAPYAAYNLMVDLFFYLSLEAGLISSQRPSNRVDVAYLYYLPFCLIFTSGDRLHQRITPFFLRKDQAFLWAPELKEDLGRLDAHYDALPESVKAQGVMRFAQRPPAEDDYLTTKLWDQFLPKWREPHRPASDRAKAKAQALAKALSDQERPRKTAGQLVKSGPHDPVAFERHVHARKGKWQVIPPEVVKTGEPVRPVRSQRSH